METNGDGLEESFGAAEETHKTGFDGQDLLMRLNINSDIDGHESNMREHNAVNQIIVIYFNGQRYSV